MQTFGGDTSAVALVLDEFGESHIDDESFNLVFRHHQKIKILKKAGLEYANFTILLRKSERTAEFIQSVKATTFNKDNGKIVEATLNSKDVFTENPGKFYNLQKFTLPQVRVGSVIEVEYVLESPFIMRFRGWEFQSDIPKLRSEYWALIPANYNYHIALRGYLPMTKKESDLIRDCFTPAGAGKADCTQMKFFMENIPAFEEEEYMTAKSNFLSAISFEMIEIRYFDGRIDKMTREWKDAEQELRRDTKFGLQLKRGRDIVDAHVEQKIGVEPDPLVKAQKIYDFIKEWYRWNEVYGEYSEFGIKKAFDSRVGNVGDINLSLIAALQYAGFNVEPVLLSTRSNGMVTELYPVLSEFNYVIAKLNLNDKVYLLDATDDFLSFGLIPERCLNGNGRVLGEKESYWYPLTVPSREKKVSIQNLGLSADGIIKGTITNTYFGYEGMEQRKNLHSYANQADYIHYLSNKWNVEIIDYEFENVEDLQRPLVLRVTVTMDRGTDLGGSFLLNPFFLERHGANPFRTSRRLYPVDFGAPLEEVLIVNLDLPVGLEIEQLPQKLGLSLPDAGGRYIFDIKKNDNKLVVNSSLLIGKSVFTSNEYHFLKELFDRVVQVQNTDILFRKGN
jgi:hypothetical protein